MTTEQQIARHIVNAAYSDLQEKDVRAVKKQILTHFGAIIAGWNSDGCAIVDEYFRGIGGKEEAAVLVRGGKLPAEQAAFINSVMARALDICDHIEPGPHIGSACIPAALAAAELAGGCSGEDFILAVAVGTDLSLRLNLAEADVCGFDPTPVIAVFSAAAASAKIMKLDETQTLNALAIAFNCCGGSFQSNVDGSLCVPVNEGRTAANGVESARLAKAGITGPANFLEGVYGYFTIFAHKNMNAGTVLKDLGRTWLMDTLNYKKNPSCAHTQGSTELTVQLMKQSGARTEDIDKIRVIINPFTSKLVGKKFEVGKNPRVDAQFNVGYCVANAAVRAPVRFEQFEAENVKNKEVLDFLEEHVELIVSEEVHKRGHYSSDMELILKDGRVFLGSIDIPPGHAGNPMTDEEFTGRFYECVEYSHLKWFEDHKDELLDVLTHIEKQDNLRTLVSLMTAM